MRPPEKVLADIAQVVFTQASDPAAALGLVRSLLLGTETDRDPRTGEISARGDGRVRYLDTDGNDWESRRRDALAERTRLGGSGMRGVERRGEPPPTPRETALMSAYLRDLRERERKGRQGVEPIDPGSARSHFEAHRRRREQHLGVLNRALEGTGFTASGLLQQAFEVMGETDPLREVGEVQGAGFRASEGTGSPDLEPRTPNPEPSSLCPECRYDHEEEGAGASCLRARSDEELLREMERREHRLDVRRWFARGLELATDFELCETIASRAGWLGHFHAELDKRGEGPSGRAFDSELEVLFFLNCFPPPHSAPVARKRPPGPLAEALNEAFDLLVDLGGSLDQAIGARVLGRGQRVAEIQSLRSRKFLSETVAQFPWLAGEQTADSTRQTAPEGREQNDV